MKLHRIYAIIVRIFKATFLRASKIFDYIFWPFMDILIMGMTATWMQKTQTQNKNIVLAILAGDVLWQVLVRSNYAIAVNILHILGQKFCKPVFNPIKNY